MLWNRTPVQIIRSARKSVSAEAKEGALLLRVPLGMTDHEVLRFLDAHRARIEALLRPVSAPRAETLDWRGHPVTVTRSDRKTLGLHIAPDGTLEARAPLRMPAAEILRFCDQKRAWLEEHFGKAAQRMENALPKLTPAELRALADRAAKLLPGRIRFYAEKIGVTYGRITVRCQRTRWGSCSSQGNLNFNCLLMLAPPDVIDSVIVHELCHRREMNHSARFYRLVYAAFPDYDRCDRWLKENGPALQARVPEVE